MWPVDIDLLSALKVTSRSLQVTLDLGDRSSLGGVRVGAGGTERVTLPEHVPTLVEGLLHVPQPVGLSHPVYGVVRRLVDKGRTWVKLSVTYDNTKDGPPGYADITKVAQAYAKAAPERIGSMAALATTRLLGVSGTMA